MKTTVVSISILFSLLVCRPAEAETAAVLNPDAEAGIGAERVELTQWLIADWLKERGVEPLMPREAAPHLSPELSRCRSADCAPRYLDRLNGVDYAVVTRIAQSGLDSGVRIEIVLVSRDGERYSQSWPVGQAIERAVDAALTHAYTAFLRDQSNPNPDRRTEMEAQKIERITVIPPEPNASADPDAIDSHSDLSEPRSSVWNHIIGGSLLAGSVPLLIASIYVAANHGECKDKDRWDRCIRYHFGEFSVTELSAGAALLLTGAFMILFEPITVEGELSVEDGYGLVRLRGIF